MKIHYLNCGTMHPRGTAMLTPQLSKIPCLCLLIEGEGGLILVDTGFGTRDMEDLSRIGDPANFVLNLQKDIEQTAVRQIQRLGFQPSDVRHIICTHLDQDHTGGLSDFPWARVHVTLAECEAALKPRNFRERIRYRRRHLSHNPTWETHDNVAAEPWFGLESMRDLQGLPPEIVLVPLPGHTRGHCWVALDTRDGWVLHCGDTYYDTSELRGDEYTPLGVKVFRLVSHLNYAKAMRSLERVRQVIQRSNGGIKTIASHSNDDHRAIFGKALD